MIDLGAIRKQYTQGRLDEHTAAADPMTQFHAWFEQYRSTSPVEPTIMTLASVDESGQPWQRVVLLKAYDGEGFIFYTNYESHKGRQLAANPPHASLHFFLDQSGTSGSGSGRGGKTQPRRSGSLFPLPSTGKSARRLGLCPKPAFGGSCRTGGPVCRKSVRAMKGRKSRYRNTGVVIGCGQRVWSSGRVASTACTTGWNTGRKDRASG